jgi:uncharacterized membrane protein YoaK (UPF0700 family)
MVIMKPSLPTLLSLNAGFVDTAGFLALQGLFTAHVTGNFVTFGAAAVHGTSGGIAKLLALPTFCVVVVIVRLVQFGLPRLGLPELRTMLGLKLLLLMAAAVAALVFGPFADSDSRWALVTGMTLVAAMAIQNAVHRIHLSDAPPSTLMTGSSTQAMLDIADLMRGLPRDRRAAVRARLGRLSIAIATFALGCGLAAGGYALWGMWCFVAPPIVAAIALFAHSIEPNVVRTA